MVRRAAVLDRQRSREVRSGRRRSSTGSSRAASCAPSATLGTTRKGTPINSGRLHRGGARIAQELAALLPAAGWISALRAAGLGSRAAGLVLLPTAGLGSQRRPRTPSERRRRMVLAHRRLLQMALEHRRSSSNSEEHRRLALDRLRRRRPPPPAALARSKCQLRWQRLLLPLHTPQLQRRQQQGFQP